MSTVLHIPRTAGLELEDAKQAMRDAVREYRTSRPVRLRQEDAAAFAAHAVQAIGEGTCVAAHVSSPTEPDTSVLLESLLERGVRVLLPVLGPGLERSWGVYSGRENLSRQAPGRPPEPSGEVLPPEALAEADAVLAPALAVDAAGTRLGQGGGWYDRALLHRRPGTPVYAMIHEAELIDEPYLPRAGHDVRVDAVVTERRWFLIDGSAHSEDRPVTG